ncbi:hypothetical protein NFI96_000153 [Prochilodus magdalenae]|nr:hypothetical protein NFI96_000153 [Prochilodus magdalenae]
MGGHINLYCKVVKYEAKTSQNRLLLIGRRLHHAGLHAHRPLPRLSLTPRHRHQRLQWCRTRLSWSDSEWQRVIFSDESRFSLGGDAQRTRVWRLRGQHRDERCVITRPEDLVSLHLHPYRTICRNCVRMFKLHGMDYHRTPLGPSTAPYRDVWRLLILVTFIFLPNTPALPHLLLGAVGFLMMRVVCVCMSVCVECRVIVVEFSKNPGTESLIDTGMGVSKQLSNDLKTETVPRHGLGEGYRKLSQRFQLSVSTGRNTVRKWKTTGTVQVKARSGRPRNIWNKQKRRMWRTVRVNPQTSPKDLQHDLAADGVTVHRSAIRHFTQGEAVWESDAEEAFSPPTSQTEQLENTLNRYILCFIVCDESKGVLLSVCGCAEAGVEPRSNSNSLRHPAGPLFAVVIEPLS